MAQRLYIHATPLIMVILLPVLAGWRSPKPAAQPSTQASVQTPAQPSEQVPTQAPASVKIDACALLLIKADTEQILGKPVDEPTHSVTGNETFSVDSCEYKMTGGTALDNATLIVTVPSNGELATG